ncbi:MAG: hypothetical protein ACPL1D_00090 [Microgenomates group bacterium]
MVKPNFAIYLGKELTNGYTGFLVENNFFLTLSVKGITAEEGRNFLSEIKNKLAEKEFKNLNDFENFIIENLKRANLPANFSIASGFLKGNLLYLKTINEGKIFLYRGGRLATIIEGDLSASGFLKDNDLLIFTLKFFSNFFSNEIQLTDFLNKDSPSEIVDAISPLIKGKNDEGLIALFIRFLKDEEDELNSYGENLPAAHKISVLEALKDKIDNWRENFSLYSQKAGKRKIVTFFIVLIIFFLLLWSVVFGVKRRQMVATSKKIEETQQIIEKKLLEAQDEAFFNLKQAQGIVEEAKNQVAELEKKIGKDERIDKIKAKITETENKIIKKEEKKAIEFFDLTIDNSDASGTRLFLDNEWLLILDTKNSTIYQLSLVKKSLNKKTNPEVKKASLLAGTGEKVLFYVPESGIYRIDEENRVKQVIKKDEAWGDIVDFWIYNNNLYLLDKNKNEIYKYTSTESGYSEKISYFKGGEQSLTQAVSMAIDSSIYVALPDQIFKFTAGEQEDFKTNFPDENIEIKKIYTDKNLEKIFVWDKKKSVIYILNKNGNYERQIFSSLLKNADDFIVFKNNAYFILGAKIYQIEL